MVLKKPHSPLNLLPLSFLSMANMGLYRRFAAISHVRLTTRQSSRRASEWVHGSEGIIPLGCEENAGLPLWSRRQTNMQSLAAKGQIGIKVGAIYLVQQDMSQQSPSSTKSIVDGDRATGPHVQAERLKGSVRVPNPRPHCSVTISTSQWHRDNCS